jgi:hypothetical protein
MPEDEIPNTMFLELVEPEDLEVKMSRFEFIGHPEKLELKPTTILRRAVKELSGMVVAGTITSHISSTTPNVKEVVPLDRLMETTPKVSKDDDDFKKEYQTTPPYSPVHCDWETGRVHRDHEGVVADMKRKPRCTSRIGPDIVTFECGKEISRRRAGDDDV